MEQYEIQVVGHLDKRRARALGCSQLRLLPGGLSALIFTTVDQAALYGLLGRLRDAGLELVAAERTARVIDDPPPEHRPSRSHRSARG